MKEVSLLEVIGRSLAKVAAGAGIAALLIWLTYVMLDVGSHAVWFYPAPIHLLIRDAME